MIKRKFLLIIAVLGGFLTSAYAQENDKPYLGKLHGGIDARAGFYQKDDMQPLADTVGINTYLNLNYEYKKFNFGLQYEIFEPPMRGYVPELKGHKLTQYFAAYTSDKLGVTLGSFYEQFGSGLIFRSYEERALGVNTSLRGLNVRYSPVNWINVKMLAGQPRKYLDYADAFCTGADADFKLSHLWQKEVSDYNFSVGGAWLLRHNSKEKPLSVEPENVNLFSVRTAFSAANFNAGLEYTLKGASQSYSSVMDYVSQSGDALLVNMDYTTRGFGISGVFRRIEHLEFRIDNTPTPIYVPLNYIPALTKQHKYALPALYPHTANAEGEIGGQLDAFWDISYGWLGKYPLKMTFNASYYRSLGDNLMKTMPFFGKEGKDLFKEISVEFEKKINSAVKSTVAFYAQNKYEYFNNNASYIELVDVLWKINKRNSIRTEIQHMNTQMVDKAWIYGLLEVGFARNWMVFGSDMHNYGAEKREHFYNAGASFTYKSLKAMASYGKNRGGLQCVGGICRFVPAYTGATVSLSYVF